MSKFDFSKILKVLLDTKDETASMYKEDIAKNKNISYLSYLTILVLIPLFMRKESHFARFHARQGLTLVIVQVAGNLLLNLLVKIPVVGWIFGIIRFAFGLVMLFMSLIGIYNVYQGKAKQLPIIGKYTIH